MTSIRSWHGDGSRPRTPWLCVIVSGWPRVSETFAVNELLTLHRAGILHSILATKGGNGSPEQPDHAELSELVTVLDDGDAEHQAEQATSLLDGSGVLAVHGYFAHQPALVAELTAAHLGIPFGFSVHALDARKVEPDELRRRSIAARVVLACNDDVAATLRSVGAEPTLLRHGVDVDRFTATPPLPVGDGRPTRLLTVGRFVEKKGFDVLLDALHLIRSDWRLTMVGNGPLLETMKQRATSFARRVTFAGALTHRELPALYATTDIVVVPSVIDSNGDRDGLPNVVLEAMASGRAIVGSRVAALGSAICDGVTGLLVEPHNAIRLAHAIDALASDPARREAMGRAAHDVARSQFSLTGCGAALCSTLEDRYVR